MITGSSGGVFNHVNNVNTTQIDLNVNGNGSPPSDDENIVEMVENEENGAEFTAVRSKIKTIQVLIFKVDNAYKSPTNFNKEIKHHGFLEGAIVNTKFTANNNLILTLNNEENVNKLLSNDIIFNKCKKINLSLAPKRLFLIIKGLSMEAVGECGVELAKLGRVNFEPVSKSCNRMVKITVDSKTVMDKLKKEGIKIGNMKLSLVDYIKPINVLNVKNSGIL